MIQAGSTQRYKLASYNTLNVKFKNIYLYCYGILLLRKTVPTLVYGRPVVDMNVKNPYSAVA